ncbi:MAG: universal stress protein [Dehalococcoidia bacterium]
MRSYGDVSDFMSGADADRVKVLVPLDGSQHAELALDYLDALSPLGSLDVHLLAVVDNTHDEPAEHLDTQRTLFEAYLHERAARLHDGLAECETRVVQGAPAAAIIEEADRIDAALVIISSHSRAGIQRWRLGSVADKVVRAVSCDTLVIGSGVEHAASKISKILLPLDGSDLAEEAGATARRLADAFGAELHLVRVVSPTSLTSTDVTGMGYASAELYEAVIEGAEAYVSEAREHLAATRAVSMMGAPADSLLTYIDEQGIDLVVMTSHGRSGVMRSALGSVTDRMLGGHAPVLVVRS